MKKKWKYTLNDQIFECIHTPSFSLSINTFFIATNFLLQFLSLALNTSLQNGHENNNMKNNFSLVYDYNPKASENFLSILPEGALANFRNFFIFRGFVAMGEIKFFDVFLFFFRVHLRYSCSKYVELGQQNNIVAKNAINHKIFDRILVYLTSK